MDLRVYLVFFMVFSGLHQQVNAQDPDLLTVRQVGKSSGTQDNPERNFRIAAGGGYAYRLGKAIRSGNNELDKFSKSLRNGYNLDLSMQYFLRDSWGLGLQAVFVRQEKNYPGSLDLPNIGTVTDYTETNQFVFVGPSYQMRYENNKFGLYWGVGLGPVFYTNTGESTGWKGSINRTAFGSYLGIAGEYRISPYVGTGLKLSAMGGSLTINEYSSEEKISVSNFMLTGFISFKTK